jgi:hypothetical protein
MRMDRRADMTKIIVVFPNFVNASKNNKSCHYLDATLCDYIRILLLKTNIEKWLYSSALEVGTQSS